MVLLPRFNHSPSSSKWSYGIDDHYRDKQHAVLTRKIGGLYIPKELVRERLAPTADGRKRKLLDLGTSGMNWAIDMALEFPDVDVTAVDLTGAVPRQTPPPNCQLAWHKFTEPLPQYHGQFDVVHLRSIASGTSDFYTCLKESSRCLRPGGLILVADGDLQLLKDDLTPQDICLDDGVNDHAPEFSWFSRVFFEAYTFMKERGLEVDTGLLIEERLKKCPVFENIETKKVYTPVGKWAKSTEPEEQAKLDFCGELMLQNMKQFTKALKPMCVECGVSAKQFDQWMEAVDWELDGLHIKCSIRWHYAWATKKLDTYPGEEEEEGPEPEPMSDPEPEVDYDEWGNEIPLGSGQVAQEVLEDPFYSATVGRVGYYEDEEEEEEEDGSGESFVQSWEAEEEEDDVYDDDDDDDDDDCGESAWSRSPSRSPELRPVELDKRYTAPRRARQRKTADSNGGEEGDCYTEEYGSARSDQQPSPLAAAPASISNNNTPLHPFLADPLVAALVGPSGSPSTVTTTTTCKTRVDVEDDPMPSPPSPSPCLAYPPHLMPGYKAKQRDNSSDDSDPLPESLPYAFLDYGGAAAFDGRPRPIRSIMNPHCATPDIAFDVAHLNAKSKNFQIRGPNPNPSPPTSPSLSPLSPIRYDPQAAPVRLDAAKLARTLPYPNPLSFAPNPAVGWAPDPEAVAAAELRARLDDMKVNGEEEKLLAEAEKVKDVLRGYRRPIVPTAPPNGRGLHDGKAGRRRRHHVALEDDDGLPQRGRKERYA
ncbi:hypothetical protein FRB97_000548 [Tulasnella sp. 331]|nr:hypothetical protein FRB97_000548 [Tulasnella sp. 331]